ncbi:DUF3991 and TOPRIM domain-containing protein [Paenibacillus sp. YN15]|uniref:DUF3991 and TOPRIM domain-containing protein n=1 Tax=Paenibacillus sp. YN15 TaxID=1742774 RepID=UPI000DCB1ECF|nr:DUF3991 and TOPRIM domain-containing protein [Paenibacillus sp. YN15]RAU91178.1 hypothetical protein DQG13_29780 [Paenibacillus sp. YN15]
MSKLPFTKEQINEANQINLMELVKSCGYQLENGGRRALHAKQSGGLYLFRDSNKYYHFSTDSRGGPIDFLMQFERMSFREAVTHLLGANLEAHTPISASRERGQLILPDRASNYRRIAWYLTHIRCIEADIVSRLMHEKKLYQQDKTSNCVFVGYDEFGTAKYCSLRGIRPERPFKQDCEHSDKSYPFHIAGNSQRVYVCESPIDAMSRASLLKLKGQDWTADHYISLGCLSDQALERFLGLYEMKEIVFCLDNDEFATYHNGSPAPNWGQEAAALFAQKYKDLGYKAYVEAPQSKDINEDLKMRQVKVNVMQIESKAEHDVQR